MALLGKAVLGVWNEVDPAIEDSFNDWYVREHIPERVSVPGMRRGRRYRAFDGTPRYMALYEAATLSVLTTGLYRWQLDNPTPWTQRVMPGFRVAQRGICDVIASAGQGIGGVATVIHFSVVPGQEDRLRAWLTRQVAALPARKQILAAHAWVGAQGEPASPTTELALRAGPDRGVEWVLAIESSEPGWLDEARVAVLADHSAAHGPAANGAAEVRPYPNYRLLYTLNGTGGDPA
ncbi:MAG: hypothetical protein AB7O80_09120 [Acetobacteraceae bacterium]